MEHEIYELNTNTVLVNNSQISLKKSPLEVAGSSASQEITYFFYGTRSFFPRLEELALVLILNQMHPICIFPFRNEIFLKILVSCDVWQRYRRKYFPLLP